MRYLLTTLIIVLSSSIYGQTTYESSNASFRTNYYLIFKDSNITFYGWELNLKKDTIYFKTSGSLTITKNPQRELSRQDSTITFKNFEFSKARINKDRLNNFQADKTVTVEPFLLHRHLIVQRTNKESLKIVMVKDLYDGRSDDFEFIRAK